MRKTLSAKIEQCAEEPFRVFFPLGLIASVIGVMLWPALSWGWIAYYPIEAHARWMVLGFGGCSIVGFLGTAGPRMIGAPPWRKLELLIFAIMPLAMMVCLAFHRIATADLIAGSWLLAVCGSLLIRFLRCRRDIPPPGFPIAFLGIFCAGVAGILLGFAPVLDYSYGFYLFCRLHYFQGLLWLPIIAVAPFLLPRFFEKHSRHSFDESLAIPPGWRRQFAPSLAAGLLVIGSFACEAWFSPRLGMGLRALTVIVYLGSSVPGLFSLSKTNGPGTALRWVVPCAAGGWLLAIVFPILRTGMLHLMFIGGVGLLILTVSTRVILGHAERHDRLASPMRWFHAIWFLTLFTAATRLTSDFLPKVRMTHFTYAAFLWLAVLAFWSWKLRRERMFPSQKFEPKFKPLG